MRKAITLLLLLSSLSFYAQAQVSKVWDTAHTSGLQLVDYAREIGADASGNIYVGGHSLVTLAQEGVITLLKYDSNGAFKWIYTSPQDELLEDMAVAPSGNCYLVGVTGNSPATNDILVMKINASGTLEWRKTFDGPGNYYDYGTTVTIDAAENVYVGGNASTVVNGMEFTALKYSSAGQLLWSTPFPSFVPSYQNNLFDITTDPAGNVFISGYQFVGDAHFLTMVKVNAAGGQPPPEQDMQDPVAENKPDDRVDGLHAPC